MSVPLDRLYDYLESVAEETIGDRTVIYRFYPHGSKKLDDLQPLHFLWPPQDYDLLPVMYCHDQEPLMWSWYQQQDPEFNLRRKSRRQVYDKCMLLHSEQRSQNLQLYQAHDFVPVYYWSHALIARDWFRYAEHVTINRQPKKCFLMYNRAWSGTREYRLKLLEKIIARDLITQVHTNFNALEPELGTHYLDHKFHNPRMRPNMDLEKHAEPTQATGASSADFDTPDYASTRVEVVLETLFDDDRLQLTEKILRPIALGHPFILACTQGSLDYLRSYGFKTFDSIWNENYDLVSDPIARLDAIVNLMQQIASWNPSEQAINQLAIDQICAHNRRLFFSEEFSQHVIRELCSNIKSAHRELTGSNTGQRFKRYQI